MSQHDSRRQDESIAVLFLDLFTIDAVYRQNHELVYSLSHRTHSPARAVALLHDRLKTAGYDYQLNDHSETVLVRLDPRRKLRIPRLNIILFVATVVSIYFLPVWWRYLHLGFTESLQATVAALGNGVGLEFTLALISILLVHEMGHFVASRRRHIVTSWPYFIPAPNIIGTFGAVIKSKSPFFNRRDLIEVGAAGPIAGWVVAVFWLLYGLSTSEIVSGQTMLQVTANPFTMRGESILMRAAAYAFLGVAPEGAYYNLSEAAFAGWVGLLVTAINLLPIGQLDGGHILYGLTRAKQHFLGKLAMVGLIVLGFQSMMWWFFAGLGLVFGVKHPPTLQDARPPSRTAFWMGVAALVILFVSFTPIPFPWGPLD